MNWLAARSPRRKSRERVLDHQSLGDGMLSKLPRFSFGFDRFSGLYLWAFFIILFGWMEPHTFLSLDTAHSIASSQSVSAMLGIALVIPLTAGVFDLSVGASANLSAIIVVVLQTQNHWAILPAILVAVSAGVLIGAVNGFVTVVLKVNSFIATLGMATIVGAVMTMVDGQNQPLPPLASAWSSLTQHTVIGFQVIIFYLLVIAVLAWWLTEHTPAGRYLYATGGNKEAARLSGVRVDKWIWLSLIGSGTIAGLAGVF